MCCNPQSSAIPGNAGRRIFDRKLIHNISCIHDIPGILIGHQFNKIIGDPLHTVFIGIAHPYIVTVKRNSSQMAVFIHSQCDHIFSGFPVKHHKLSHTVIFRGIRSDQHKFVGQTNPLRALGCTENIFF